MAAVRQVLRTQYVYIGVNQRVIHQAVDTRDFNETTRDATCTALIRLTRIAEVAFAPLAALFHQMYRRHPLRGVNRRSRHQQAWE